MGDGRRTALYPSEKTKSLELWSEGKDTKDISFSLGVPESVVYNFLSRARDNK